MAAGFPKRRSYRRKSRQNALDSSMSYGPTVGGAVTRQNLAHPQNQSLGDQPSSSHPLNAEVDTGSAWVLLGRRDAKFPRSPLVGHYVVGEILLRHMSSKPVSGQCDKRMLGTAQGNWISVANLTVGHPVVHFDYCFATLPRLDSSQPSPESSGCLRWRRPRSGWPAISF